MATPELHKLGEELRDLVFERTGIDSSDLICPRAKSDMTPCVVRDGGMCVIVINFDLAVCVGCETSITRQIEKEKQWLKEKNK